MCMDAHEVLDKKAFKVIFKEHWEDFKKRYSKYTTEYYDEVIQKMLLCGEKEGGYGTYRCKECGDEIKVAFSCKSCFCLSCSKVYVDNWVEYIGSHLYEGVHYRHIVLTVPEDLRIYFYREGMENKGYLYKAFIRSGVEMLNDAVKTYKKKEIKLGYIVVIQLVGRAGNWNPHLHIIMTSGGIDEENNKWIPLKYFPFEILHKKWQYHLLNMLKKEVKDRRIKEEVDRMWKKYPNGLVANWEKGDVPRDPKGLARYLAKYVVSPPIAIKRIMEYDGKQVKYWYKDHKSKEKEEIKVDVLTFIGRLVQSILPKGFHRIRYYGIQATCIFKKIKKQLKEILGGVKEAIKGAYQVVRKTFQERMIETYKIDPFKCKRCGGIMELVAIWHPKYGEIKFVT